MSDLPPGFAELPADVQLDQQPTTASTPTPPPAPTPAAPAVATGSLPAGYAELPPEVHLDQEDGITGETTDDSPPHPELEADQPPKNDSGISGSFVHGAADTITAGFLDELGALPDTLGLTPGRPNIWHSDGQSFGDLFSKNVALNRDILHADEAQHPDARLVGELIGGLAIPSGLEGVGLKAGKSVLEAGGSMREARAAAAAAVRLRAGAVGAAYGAAHGIGSAEGGLADRLEHGALGAVEGGASAFGLTAAGQAAAKYGAPAVAAVRGILEKGDTPVASAEAAPDYAQIARDLNIQRTPATTSKTGISAVAQSGLGALPGGAPIAAGAEREVADLGAAAKNTAESIGPVSDRQGAGEAVAQGAAAYKTASGKQGGALYDQRDALMGGKDAPVPTDSAAGALGDMASRFPNSPAIQQLREHPAIRAIGGALPGEPEAVDVPTGVLDANGNMVTRTVTSGGEPLTLGEVTEALSHVRGVQRNLAAQSVTTTPVMARVNQLEQALEDDVTTAATKADMAAGRVPGAEGSALKAQQDADAFWADRAAALNGALKRPLQSASDDTKVPGEAVYNQIYGDMNLKSGNLARLRETWFRLPPQAKSTFAATAVDDLGRSTPGAQNDTGTAWSYQTFLTNLNKLSPQSRNIVFGANADKQLGQIAAYANRLRQLDKLRNFSNTAQKYFAGAFMATVGGAFMHGNIQSAAEAAAALPATWAGAKFLLATPKMRDWTLQSMKALSGDAANSETALRVLTKRLGSIATADPAIADHALGLQQRILQAVNDNAPHAGRMAAQSPGQGPDNANKQAKGN